MHEQIRQAAAFVRQELGEIPPRAVVLGSGLGVLVDHMDGARELSTAAIPHFPVSTVPGHAGRLVAGRLDGTPVLALKGRVHAYEGYSQEQVVFPIRLFAALGVKALVTTNAVGCVNRLLRPGDLVLLTDQLNLMFRNPLRGPNDDALGPRFPDMSAAYDPGLNQCARETARELGLDLKCGVMAGLLGPSYETPAEIRMLARLEADVVGMSTIPEAIAARHLGLPMAAISCVTNYAAGLGAGTLNHAEVTDVAEQARERFSALLSALLARI
ncbi:MAG: purine-nucleoside phosphorylase [Candidatus Delongbacteria bacterium]